MKPKTIKLILSLSLVAIILAVLIFLFIKFIGEKRNNDTLIKISKLTEIQNELAAFHFKYGKYPISPTDIIINKSILCIDGFRASKEECSEIFWEPKGYIIDFIYNQNEKGDSYTIRFSLKDDNKYLNCVHDRKEKKRGCSFVLNLGKELEVIK